VNDDEASRRRRARRTAVLLGLLALAVYITFFVLNTIRD
jgi:hypothetical protein